MALNGAWSNGTEVLSVLPKKLIRGRWGALMVGKWGYEIQEKQASRQVEKREFPRLLPAVAYRSRPERKREGEIGPDVTRHVACTDDASRQPSESRQPRQAMSVRRHAVLASCSRAADALWNCDNSRSNRSGSASDDVRSEQSCGPNSRRMDPMTRSQYGLCQVKRGAVRTSSMPMSSTRVVKSVL